MGNPDGVEARAAAFRSDVRAVLGDGAILDAATDVRLVQHVSARHLGGALALVRPRTTHDVEGIVERAIAHDLRLVPLGHGTTFWGGLEVDGAVVVDTTGLDTPTRVDLDSRTAHVGAGCRVRTLDRLARRVGLCLPARPDGAGDTSLGSLFSVASCAGLGLGVALPVAQIEGGVAVGGTGARLVFGSGPYLHGRALGERGLPGLRSVLEGAEGRGAIVTELFVRLVPAPYVATVTAEGPGGDLGARARAFVEWARRGFDEGGLETARLELAADARMPTGRLSVLVRVTSNRGPDVAAAQAERVRSALDGLGFLGARTSLESEAARRGEPGADDTHWTFPEGQTRARLHGLGFHGLELTTAYGPALEALLDAMQRLHEDARALAPAVRRFAIYPAPSLVSVGVQLLVPPGAESVARTEAFLASQAPSLLALGVPYRGRGRFADVLAAHAATPLAAPSARALDAVFDVLDPDRRIFAARGSRADA